MTKFDELLSQQSQTEQKQTLIQLTNELLTMGNLNIECFSNEKIQILKNKIHDVNFKEWINFIVRAMTIEEKFQYATSGASQNGFLPLVEQIGNKLNQNQEAKVDALLQIVPSNSQLESEIFLHSFIANYCASVSEKLLNKVLPLLIRLSSIIVEKFLQLKNQPAKGSEDRIENDKIILNNCEKWVSKNILKFFGNLPSPTSETSRQILLLAICDITGALMEILRDSIIDKQIIDALLNGIWETVRRIYPIKQMVTVFLNSLIFKKFNNPVIKIQIPEIYTEKHLLTPGPNPQSFAFLTQKYLSSTLPQILPPQKILSFLIPSYSQLLPRSFQLKLTLESKLLRTLQKSKQIKIQNGYDFGYPIQLFLFYVYQFRQEKYQQIDRCFVFDGKETQINSLSILTHIKIDGYITERNRYILQKLQKTLDGNTSQRSVLILRQFNFKTENAKNQQIILELVKRLKNGNKELAQRLLTLWKKDLSAGQSLDKIVALLSE